MELEPWFLPRFPARIFSPRGFLQWGRFFLASVLPLLFQLLAVAQLCLISVVLRFLAISLCVWLFHFCAFQCTLRSVDPE